MLDIFNGDAFSVVQLTHAIRDVPYKPGRLGELKLFTERSTSALTITIERIGQTFKLIPPSPRGAPGDTRTDEKRSLRSITIPHFTRSWGVFADEVQSVRAFGSETMLRTVQGLVMERMAQHMTDFDLTEEHARLGAITGVVTYADNSTLNLFSEMGVDQDAEIDFDLDNASPASGALRKKCTDVIRATRKNLGGTPFTGVHCFCGDTFFDQLLARPEVRETYVGWSEAQILRDSYVGPNRSSNPMFTFGGITFENYGAVDDTVVDIGVAATKAHFIPMGVAGLFETWFAPADYMETVNTLGQRLYAKQWARPDGKGINGELQMNALQVCTRPKALLKAKNT